MFAFLGLDAVEWAQVLAPVFAAAAAVAAWRSASVSERALKRSLQPELVAQALAFRKRQLHFDVLNGGGGVGLGCGFLLVAGDHYVAGHLAHGLLRPGETMRVRTTMPPTTKSVEGVLIARDTQGNVWAWNMEGDPKWLANSARRRKKEGHVKIAAVFASAYPGVDLDSKVQHPYDVLAEADLSERRLTRGAGSVQDAVEAQDDDEAPPSVSP